jgi:hypothetical protein
MPPRLQLAERAEHPGITADVDKFHEAVKAIRRLAPVSNDEWDKLTEDEQERSLKVGVMAQGDLVQDVFDGLVRAVEEGTTFDDFKAEIGQSLAEDWGSEDGARLEAIFRTNVLGAYNEGREEIFNDPAVKEDRPFWRWELIDDGRQSDDDPCLDCEDVVLPADDPWWDAHPRPMHPNCRCTFSALSHEEAEEAGITDSAPAATGGFGDEDWEPNPSRFDESIRAVIEDRLK